MIHSLAGGELKSYEIQNLAQIQFENQDEKFWYITEIKNLKIGDFVLAPFGAIDELQKAKVIKIELGIKSQNFPISFKKLKKIYKKV